MPRPNASVVSSRVFSSKRAFISSISLLSLDETNGRRNRTVLAANGFLRDTSHARSTVLYAPASQLIISSALSSVKAVTRTSRRLGSREHWELFIRQLP
ncbi:hypothetical protein D3C87_1709780 [compost metagenome]